MTEPNPSHLKGEERELWLAERRELKEAFLDWLVDPNRTGSQTQWAKDHGLDRKRIEKWKATASFQEEYQKRLAALNINSERIQAVVDAMWKKATDGDVRAAQMYLAYVDRLDPQRIAPVVDERDPSSMSDEDLKQALRAAADSF